MSKIITTARNRSESHHRNHPGRSNGNLKSLGDEAGTILTRTAEETADEIKGFQSRVSDGIAVARVRINDAVKAVRKQAVHTDKVIRAKPYHAVAVAAGLGLLAEVVALLQATLFEETETNQKLTYISETVNVEAAALKAASG